MTQDNFEKIKIKTFTAIDHLGIIADRAKTEKQINRHDLEKVIKDFKELIKKIETIN